jgi:glycerol uptake facilitator protein
MLLIVLGGGVVAGELLKKSKAEGAGWITIPFTWGLAVTFAIYAVGQFSGAHINPAVTLGIASIGEFSWDLVPGYILAQTLGAMAGAAIVWIHYLPHWGQTSDKDAKLAIFCTIPAIRSYAANMLSEIIATMVLLLGILFIGANQFTEGLNPLVVGGLIMVIGFGLGGTTGFAINPARDFGPRLMHFLLPIKGKGGSDWSYSSVPIIGPVIGGILGAQMYKAIFHHEITLTFWITLLITIVVAIAAIIKNK